MTIECTMLASRHSQRWRIVTAAVFCLSLSAMAIAQTVNQDGVYEYVGTIAKIQYLSPEIGSLTVQWPNGARTETGDVVIVNSTSVTRNGVGQLRSELRPGVRVKVWAEISPYNGLLEATDIILLPGASQ